MSTRKTPFANGEFYHVYNRGVDKRSIFSNKQDLDRFFKSMEEFNSIEPIGSLYENSFKLGGSTAKFEETEKEKNRLVNFIAYCLNSNHFHFILEQVVDGGISEFMKRLSGGYTWYFNNKYKRAGSLFQGKFKSIHIDSGEYLLHLSVYVNLNYLVHRLGGSTAKSVESKSSWGEYIKEDKFYFCEKDIILEQFQNKAEYKRFAENSLQSILESRYELDNLEDFLLE